MNARADHGEDPCERRASGMRCGFAALIGAPNAGKSTLLNALVGTKVSIVSRKVQTTRTRITGIVVAGNSQIVFVDTPGIFLPHRRLDRAMIDAAWHSAEEAEEIVLLVDAAQGVTDDVSRIIETLAPLAKTHPPLLALNKVDLVKKETLLVLSQQLNEMLGFAETFMISATTGDGVDDLRAYLAAAMPDGSWLYPADQISDVSERLLAAEITREKIYDRLHQELPYVSTVETESWEERPDGSVRIGQVVYLQRAAHKPIILGKGGRTIKAIGQMARTEIGQLLDRPVHLFLHVKVKERWQEDPERYALMNLPFSV